MSIDAPQAIAGLEEAGSDLHVDRASLERVTGDDKRRAREREAVIQRILAQRKPELIQEGVEAYKRDLPRLLEENRYRQLVAYRGDKLVAFAATHRQLKRRLTKAGCTDRGELFITSIGPLDIDD